MNDKHIKTLQKEIKELGIINIKADDELTADVLEDAIQAVKDTNLDFAELAYRMKEERKRCFIL